MSASAFLFILFTLTRSFGVVPLSALAPCLARFFFLFFLGLSEESFRACLRFRASVETRLMTVEASRSPDVVAVAVAAVDLTTVGVTAVLVLTSVTGVLTTALADATVVDAVVAATEALSVVPKPEGGVVSTHARLPFGIFTFGGTTCASLSTL
jgi:hypothetical protein